MLLQNVYKVADELPASAADRVAVLGVELMRGTEPGAGGDGCTACSFQSCGGTLGDVDGGEGESKTTNTHAKSAINRPNTKLNVFISLKYLCIILLQRYI